MASKIPSLSETRLALSLAGFATRIFCGKAAALITDIGLYAEDNLPALAEPVHAALTAQAEGEAAVETFVTGLVDLVRPYVTKPRIVEFPATEDLFGDVLLEDPFAGPDFGPTCDELAERPDVPEWKRIAAEHGCSVDNVRPATPCDCGMTPVHFGHGTGESK